MSALADIAAQMAAAVAPLERALTDPGEFRAFMLRIGWRASTIPQEWMALATDFEHLASATTALSADPHLEDVVAAVAAIADLRGHVAGLTTAPPGVDASALLGELRELLVERLIIDQLARGAPRTFGLLSAFGLIAIERQPATVDRPPHSRCRFDVDKLVALVRDPSKLPELAYAWGLANFDAEAATRVLLDLALRIGLPAQLRRSAGSFPGYPALPIGESSILVPIVDAIIANTPVQLAIGVAVLPPDAGGPGLVIAPQIPGITDGALALGGDLNLRVVTGTGAPIELALLITPAGFDVALPGSGTLPAGGVGVEATLAIAGRLGTQTGTRFELTGVTFGVYLDHDDSGEFARLAGHLDGSQIVVAPGDQDGVVAKLLGNREMRVPFPLGIEWASRGGFGLTIGPGALAVPGSLTLGPLQLDNLALQLAATDHGLTATIGARITTTIGPITIVLDRVGARASLDRSQPGALGLGSFDAGVALPTSAGLVIASSVVTGGGQIGRDPATGRYSGAVELAMFHYQIVGAAILDTRTPEGRELISFVALAAARFPGIPLVLGLLLDGLGGVFGLHRRADDQAMRAAIRAGKLADLLMPDDPKLGLANLLVQLGSLFPVAEGRFVAGPSARIGWGTPRMLAADVMVLVEGPSPIRIVMLASGALGLPTLDKRIIDIRIDALGVVDLDRGTLAVDESLHDSKIANAPLTGDLALRAQLSSPRSLLVSIGGFHPRFTAPADFPTLRRVEVIEGDNPQLRMSAYLARTPNSVQVGAQVDLTATGGGFEIKAHVGFDALIENHPLHFDVDISATADVSWHGHHLVGLDLSFNLTGPHPYHAKGSASFSILWWDVSVGFDQTWGDDSPDELPPPPDLGQILRDALAGDEAWTADLPAGQPTWLSIRPGVKHAIHPFASIVVVERALPLDYDITMYGSIPTATQRFAISGASIAATPPLVTAAVSESFALGQFTRLSQDDQLAAPSFEDFNAGFRFGDGLATPGSTASASLEIDTIEIDDLAPPPAPPPFMILDGVFATLLGAVRPALEPAPRPLTAPALVALRYTVASTQTLAATGVAGTYAAARDALQRASVPDLQIVPAPHASPAG